MTEGDSPKFYAVTTHRDHRDSLVCAVFTGFVNFSARNEHWEVRRASLVNIKVAIRNWLDLEEEFSVARTPDELISLAECGGNILLEARFAEEHLPKLLRPYECVKDNATSLLGSFIPTEDVADEDILRRAPARKLRMRVLKRDDYKCVICGRRPRDYPDIELHVHHVLPWRFYGPTTEWNLATFCGTCHMGLDPDYEPEVRELAGLPSTDHPYYRHPPAAQSKANIGDFTDNFLFLSGEVEDFLESHGV